MGSISGEFQKHALGQAKGLGFDPLASDQPKLATISLEDIVPDSNSHENASAISMV